MSNEPSKKSATQPESAPLDLLPDELSAAPMTGDDPLDYDWMRGAATPPSEAAYLPSMEMQARDMDTGDLAKALGREAVRVARYASSRNSRVIIDKGREGGEMGFEIDVDDGVPIDKDEDGMPTQRMPAGPATKQDSGSTRGASSDRWHRSSTVIALIVVCAGLFLCVIYFLARPGVASTPTSSSSRALSADPTVVSKPLEESASTCAPCNGLSEAPQQRALPESAVEPAATAVTRAASPPRAVAPKQVRETVDPLFIEKPGY
jgi:hypothetical protein